MADSYIDVATLNDLPHFTGGQVHSRMPSEMAELTPVPYVCCTGELLPWI